ncbi:MAG TPA: hypothetical protein VLT79_02285 [Gemmatimonadales bacterium]|nr:hypothetical protein [Gemmatimonadales bacterium]
MHSRIAVVFAALAALAVLAPAQAQQATGAVPAGAPPKNTAEAIGMDPITLMRMNLRQRKAEVIGQALQLPDSVASKFWPLYREYEAGLAALWDKRIAMMNSYATSKDSMTADRSRQFVNKMYDLDEETVTLARTQYDKFAKVLPTPTLLRYYQVSTYIERMIMAQVWSQMPEIH